MYHGIAAFFYLSASVSLAKVTLDLKDGAVFQNYQLDISAVVSQPVSRWMDWSHSLLHTFMELLKSNVALSLQVFSYVTTLLYFIHTILSAIRWKSF